MGRLGNIYLHVNLGNWLSEYSIGLNEILYILGNARLQYPTHKPWILHIPKSSSDQLPWIQISLSCIILYQTDSI